MHVVVLGAGAVGTATAYFLNQNGHDVTLIERQNEAALETSWGNGCVIHASESEPWSAPGMPQKILGWMGKESAPLLVRYHVLPHILRWGLSFVRNCTPQRFHDNSRANLELALLSLRMVHEIEAETDFEFDHASRGVLKIYRSRESLAAARRAMDALTPFGLLHRPVDVATCVELEPALASTASTLAGGIYFERDEVADCNKFTQGLAKTIAARGVNLRFGETVQGIGTQNGRVTGVLTSQGLVAADAVVVAMGSYTAPLLKKLGVYVPIYPVKGISITFGRGDWDTAPKMPVIDDSKIFGLVPVGDRMRISGSAEVTGFDTNPAMSRARAIAENAQFTFPEMRDHLDWDEAIVWAGLRPVSPAGTPLIGKTPVDGLWVNSGHGHLGWTMACGSGRVLADLMDGRSPPIPRPPLQGALVAD